MIYVVIGLLAALAILRRHLHIHFHLNIGDPGAWIDDDGDGGEEIERPLEERDPPRVDETARLN